MHEMFVLILFAFIAGIVTILSPCILPILPIVLSGSLTGGKRRPLGVITGFILSFTFFAVFSFALAKALGISTEILRNLAVIFLIIFGLSIFFPSIQALMERFIAKFNINPNAQDTGFRGGLMLGVTLGFVWTPCVGPILASVLALAATSQITLDLLLITSAYSLGTAIPLFAITYGGARVLNTLPVLKKRSVSIQKAFGMLILLTALMIFFNIDRKFQVFILEKFPQYGEGITSIEDNEFVKKELEKFKVSDEDMPKTSTLDEIINDYPKAPNPNFSGATQWLNSDPLTLEFLEGKVVLVDFWTYTCINCIRTFPYLTSWYEKYKDDGFVIIGVHTPEFEFEKESNNVIKATKEYGITYPVVQDNNYKIWESYRNRYWPAHYLIDKRGRIRFTHFGEGKYEETEKKIRELLAEDGKMPDQELTNLPSNLPLYQRTPETYLGYARIERFSSPEEIVMDRISQYSIPKSINSHFFAYGGKWEVHAEYAQAEKGSSLVLNFEAKEVYLVMKPHGKGIPEIAVFLDNEPINAIVSGKDVQNGIVKVDTDRLYKLLKLDKSEEHILRLQFLNEPIEVFAFTFG